MPKGIPKNGINSSRFQKGVKPWNYGKVCTGYNWGRKKGFVGKKLTAEHLAKWVEAGASKRRGQPAWNSGTNGLQVGHWKGKTLPDELKLQISNTLKGKYVGENACNWKGGLSLIDYGSEFTRELKRYIRNRDGYICQHCKLLEEHNHQNNKKYNLSIHHIDYNKKNNIETNLISLCVRCHLCTNSKRDMWTQYFQIFIHNIYKYKII